MKLTLIFPLFNCHLYNIWLCLIFNQNNDNYFMWKIHTFYYYILHKMHYIQPFLVCSTNQNVLFFFLWYGVYFQNLLLERTRLAQSSPKGVRSSDWTWPVHLVAQPTFNASPDTDLQTLTNMLLPATVLSDYLASSSVDIPLLAKNKFNHLSISDDHYFFKPDRFVIIIQPWS